MRLIEQDPCFTNALPDEPGFVLLARDPLAPALVRLWCAQRRVAIAEGARPISDLGQVEAAERTAEQMETWRRDADEAWRDQPQLAFPPVSDGATLDTFGQDIVPFPNERDPLAGQHLARREQDEYVCTRCTKRWGVAEDAPEACA